MTATKSLASYQTKYACEVMGVTRSHYYMSLHEAVAKTPKRKTKVPPRNQITPKEKSEIVRILCSERYADLSPYQAYYQLLDEGVYLCSIRSMYRIHHEHGLVCERWDIRRHGPKRSKPVLSAKPPNQVWSWVFTKLRGRQTGRDYSLYVVLDIFSRAVVASTVKTTENQ